MMNPYEAPSTPLLDGRKTFPWQTVCNAFIAILLAVGVIVGLVSALNPSVGAVMRSGFGLVDSLICIIPLLQLLVWLFFRRAAWAGPEIHQIGGAAVGAVGFGVAYANELRIFLSHPEEVSHSSTVYYLYLKLLSFVAIGVCLSWQAFSMTSNSRVAIKGEPSADPKDPTVVDSGSVIC
jgi:hypothetical protein